MATTRRDVRPGLSVGDFYNDMGKVAGKLFITTSRNDLKFWIDQQTFPYYLKQDDHLLWAAKHTGCSVIGNLMIKHDIDRPKIAVVCSACMRSWYLFQLEAMLPKSFSATFEYSVMPQGDWPVSIVVRSNGVTKYTGTQSAGGNEAAEYFFKEFDEHRKNGFRRKPQ